MDAIIVSSSDSNVDTLKRYIDKVGLINLVSVLDNPEEALASMNHGRASVFFMSGELIGKKTVDLFDYFSSCAPVVVFASDEKYALQSFDAGAADYLLMPSSLERFLQAVKRVDVRLNKGISSSEVTDMYVRSNAKSLRVPFDSVLFVEAMADYVIIHGEDCKYIVHYTMKGIQDKLPSEKFVRVHRSYIVNMDKIYAIDNQEILIKDKRIPIGASNKEYFFSRLNII